jgi:hypothetical protein
VANDARNSVLIFLRSFGSDSFAFSSDSSGGSPDSLRKRRRSLFNRSTVSMMRKHWHFHLP